MAKVTCAISGVTFTTAYMDFLTVPHSDGYLHPIFALSKKQLHKLYIRHCRNLMVPSDSYLLFCALLHSSNSIEWNYPITAEPTDKQTSIFIENNIKQLVSVLIETDKILHPSFKQPKFRVTYENSSLGQVNSWIKCWRSNIIDFGSEQSNMREYESLKKLTNKLTRLITSGIPPEDMPQLVANWAANAGDFPKDKSLLYRTTIANSFNRAKMFNTPLTLLKEVKEYCQSNIDVGSIHFHRLVQVLDAGIKNHIDYLGGSSETTGYTLLPTSSITKEDKERVAVNTDAVKELIASAPATLPVAADYNSSVDFLRAKLAYRAALSKKQTEAKEADRLALIAKASANIETDKENL